MESLVKLAPGERTCVLSVLITQYRMKPVHRCKDITHLLYSGPKATGYASIIVELYGVT